MPTFDGETLIVTLDSGVTTVSVADDLYKEWKLWQLDGNMRFPAAFSTEGGQATTATGTVSAFYFLRNDLGWRLRGPEEDIEIYLQGNLYGTDPDLPIRVMTIGNYNSLMAIDRDASSVVETVVSGSGLSTEQATWLEELHKRFGLRAGKPLTETPAGAVVDDVTLVFTGNGVTSSTVTRT